MPHGLQVVSTLAGRIMNYSQAFVLARNFLSCWFFPPPHGVPPSAGMELYLLMIQWTFLHICWSFVQLLPLLYAASQILAVCFFHLVSLPWCVCILSSGAVAWNYSQRVSCGYYRTELTFPPSLRDHISALLMFQYLKDIASCVLSTYIRKEIPIAVNPLRVEVEIKNI